LRLSPTFVADNGQRMKPHAASATINARARPHATGRRMLSNSPFEPRRATGCADSYREPASKATKQGDKALKINADDGRSGRGRNGEARGDDLPIPMSDLAERQSGCLLD
jgi:hypothetical protein